MIVIKRKAIIKNIIKAIKEEYRSCRLCPWQCGVNRLEDSRGICGVGKDSEVFNTTVLVYENSEIAPTYAIYFAGCSLQCLFCSAVNENTQVKSCAKLKTKSQRSISQQQKNYSRAEIKTDFMEVEKKFVKRIKREIEQTKPKTISFIGGEPSVHLLTIFELIDKLESNLPLVFYSNMYFQPKIRQILKEWFEYLIVDIHYGNDRCAKDISRAKHYFKTVTENIIALQKKLILRHLLLPGHVECCYKRIIDWMAMEIPEKPLYLLTNYFPYGSTHIGTDSESRKAGEKRVKEEKNRELTLRPTTDEITEALDYAKNKGIIIKMLDLLKPRQGINKGSALNQEIIIEEDGTVAFKYFDGVALAIAKEIGEGKND
ncbi:MAG: radical SAM protein [bacterium]